MKQLTQKQAADIYNTKPRVAAVKDKPVFIKAVTEPYHYVTLVAGSDGGFVEENAGVAEAGYIRQQVISAGDHEFVNEYVIRDEAELAKRYDVAEDQSDVREGWVRYLPKPGAVKQVCIVHEEIEFPNPWAGNPFRLQAGGVLVDNGDGQVYGINPVEFKATHSVLPFINLTPHSVGVVDAAGQIIDVPPCGQPARVDYTDVGGDYVFAPAGVDVVFDSVERHYGQVQGLPPEGSVCVVSMPVAERCAGREGVYYPDSGRDCIRDDKGQIKAVRRLVKASGISLSNQRLEELAMAAGFDVDEGEVLSSRDGSLASLASLLRSELRIS